MKRQSRLQCILMFFFVLAVSTIQAQSAAFSYPSDSICQNGLNVLPIFTNGGVFIEITNGLSLNSVTGEINPGTSFSGAYSVTHIISTPLADTANIIITILPDVLDSIGYSQNTYCSSDPNAFPVVYGATGGTFSSMPPSAAINPTTGEINLAAISAGTYNIAYQLQGLCPDTAFFQITVVPTLNQGFNYGTVQFCMYGDSTYCPAPEDSLCTWSSPTGLAIDSLTGCYFVDANYGGPHTIYKFYPNPCDLPDTSILDYIPADDTTQMFYVDNEFCQEDANPSPVLIGDSNGVFLSVQGLVFFDTLGTILLQNSTPGTYFVRYQLPGACGSLIEDSITIHAQLQASITRIFVNSADDSLIARPNGAGYSFQWFHTDPFGNETAISGATDSVLLAPGTYSLPGIFSVDIFDPNTGCTTREEFTILTQSEDEKAFPFAISIADNPGDGMFRIEMRAAKPQAINWQIYNALGKLIQRGESPEKILNHKIEIDLRTQPAGVHLLHIESDGRMSDQKLLRL